MVSSVAKSNLGYFTAVTVRTAGWNNSVSDLRRIGRIALSDTVDLSADSIRRLSG